MLVRGREQSPVRQQILPLWLSQVARRAKPRLRQSQAMRRAQHRLPLESRQLCQQPIPSQGRSPVLHRARSPDRSRVRLLGQSRVRSQVDARLAWPTTRSPRAAIARLRALAADRLAQATCLGQVVPAGRAALVRVDSDPAVQVAERAHRSPVLVAVQPAADHRSVRAAAVAHRRRRCPATQAQVRCRPSPPLDLVAVAGAAVTDRITKADRVADLGEVAAVVEAEPLVHSAVQVARHARDASQSARSAASTRQCRLRQSWAA